MGFEINSTSPRVSVGILTRNGGKLFHKVMEGLIGQQTPWPFEVVILDSASKDGTDTHAAARGEGGGVSAGQVSLWGRAGHFV